MFGRSQFAIVIYLRISLAMLRNISKLESDLRRAATWASVGTEPFDEVDVAELALELEVAIEPIDTFGT